MKQTRAAGPRSGTGFGSILLTLALLGIPLLNMDLDFGPILSFLGRLHPVVVHFPIVLILCTVVLEWLFGSFKGPIGIAIIRMMYYWSLYSSVVAVVVGYFLYSTGDYGGDLIKYHFWSGVGVTILMIWSLHFRRQYTKTHRWRWRQLSRILLLLAGMLIVYTGHLGGSLTHGPDFLSEPIRNAIHERNLQERTVLKDPASLKVFDELILPAFNQTCLKCHNEQNAKSDLDLSTFAAIEAGGKSLKPMIVPGSPEESELYIRISLPPKHDDFMPPDGKPPLKPAEVQLIRSWIIAGADPADTLGHLMLNDTLKATMDAYLPELAENQLSKQAQRLERLKTGPKLIRLGLDLGLEIRPDEETDSAYYSASMLFPPKIVTDETLAQLMPYKDYFSKLSLVGADITDEGLYYIGQMSNLQNLILTKSCIKGEGLSYLSELPNLEVINLSHTYITDEHVLHLSHFPALKKAYVFNTYVTPGVVAVLDAYMKEAEVTLEEGDYY